MADLLKVSLTQAIAGSPVQASLAAYDTSKTNAPESPESYQLISQTQIWADLQQHADNEMNNEAAQNHSSPFHLRRLVQDPVRCAALTLEHDGMVLDASRQRVTLKTLDMLYALAETAGVSAKIRAMAVGEKINTTENRSVGHMALRLAAAPGCNSYILGGQNVAPDVQRVLKQIQTFSEAVREGKWKGATGKRLTDVVAIGIGGSYLGAEFVAEALHTDDAAGQAARGRRLRFLANVDPVAVARALEGLSPETTLVIVISKTFTTAETMLNARTVRQWIISALGDKAVAKHMVAVSTNLKDVQAFGIDPHNAFEFWDWVGGRYSVCSAVGLLPLALQYGYDIVDRFLAGARSIDLNFINAKPRANLPLLLGLLGVWNSSFLKFPTRALASYAQALHKFAPHIQQVDMESNGKRVTSNGAVLDFTAGEVDFGEPGTNGQHSFYQLFHQGRVVPVDFVGFVHSQKPIHLKGEPVSNHDELMANFFAQPDALAVGKNADELKADGVKPALIPHQTFPGNRPSNVLLLPRLSAYEVGQLLALYEHRTAVQGFIWGINSFDQMGVELGKVLATQIRKTMAQFRKKPVPAPAPVGTVPDNKQESKQGTSPTPMTGELAQLLGPYNPSTQQLLVRYLYSGNVSPAGNTAPSAPAKL